MKNKSDAQAPARVQAIARTLPAGLKFLACHGMHTLAYECDRCVICGKHIEHQKSIGIAAMRHPPTRSSPQQTSINIALPFGVALTRQWYVFGGDRWSIHWQHKSDQYRAFVKPTIDFGAQNVSAKIRAEQRERQGE